MWVLYMYKNMIAAVYHLPVCKAKVTKCDEKKAFCKVCICYRSSFLLKAEPYNDKMDVLYAGKTSVPSSLLKLVIFDHILKNTYQYM